MHTYSIAFVETFKMLRELLKPYEHHLVVKHDTEDNYYLNTRQHPGKPAEEGFFGAVQIKKNYVSFHLFPIYVYPELASSMSPELTRRKQGKACFNFKRIEPALFAELERLVEDAFLRFVKEQWIKDEGRMRS